MRINIHILIYPIPDPNVTSDCDEVWNHVIGPDFRSRDRIGTSLDVTELPPTEWRQIRDHNIWGKSSERTDICAVIRPSHQEPGEKPWYHPRLWWFDTLIRNVTKISFYHFRNIAKVRAFLSQANKETVMHAFITSRLDYCNALLSGLPKKTIGHLQLVQIVAAQVLTKTRQRTHKAYFKVTALVAH